MVTTEATLLLDAGGQGCRALVADARAGVLFQAECAIPTVEAGGRVEQDAGRMASALAGLAEQAAAAVGARGIAIGRAALAVQRGSVACWDRRSGEPLAPALSWRDRRGLPGMQALAGRAGEIKRRTGLRFSPYGGASKLAWCLQELDAVRDAADAGRLAWGPLGGFLLTRLTDGRPLRVDDTLAQRTLLWSRERFDWDPWLLAQFGLPGAPLPVVVESRSAHGWLENVPGSPPLALLVGDQNAVPFIDGEPDPDTLYINLGTGAFLLRPLRSPVDTDLFQLSLLDRTGGGRWALEASVHGAASAIAWLECETDRHIPHARFQGLRERVGAPPLFLNSIDGLGPPWWQAGPAPAFIADSGAADPDLDARLLAVLESIAFLVRANVEAMGALVGAPARVVLSGGLSRADVMCALIADALERDLLRLRQAEGTALGAWCMLGRRALPAGAFEPVPHRPAPALGERYHRWRERLEAAMAAG